MRRRNPSQDAEAPGPSGNGARLRVLVADGSGDARPLLAALRDAGLAAEQAQSDAPRELAETVGRGWDVLVTRRERAAAVRAAVRDCNVDTPVVVVRAQQGAGIAADVQRAFAEATARRERRRVAERLQTSEIRLRAAIEGGFDAFFVFDSERGEDGALDFRLVEINSRGAEIFGAPKEELIGKLFAEIAVDPERAAYFLERFRTVFESGVPLEEEYRVRSPEIAARWLYFQIVPLLTGIAITARDVSEKKESHRALRDSEARLLSVVQHVPGVFFTLVPSEENPGTLRFDFVSDGIETLTGHAVDEFFGADRITLQGLLHADDRALIDETDAMLVSGQSFAVDIRVVHRDGTVRWAHLKVEPTFDDHGSVAGASGVMLDISDRKVAEEALRLRDRAIDALVQGVVITDATQPALPVVYVNPGYEHLTGFTRDELIGRPAVSLATAVHESDETEIQRAIAEGRPIAREYDCRRKDGSVFRCSLLLSPVRGDDDVVTHFVSISSDETPRKELEEQVQQAQKMEAVGRLAGGVAHDFNNVLLVIRGYSHVLLDMLGTGRDGWVEAKEIETAAIRATELVHQLLAFSRRQVMQTQLVDVNAVVSELETLLTSSLGEDVELVISVDPKVGMVDADPAQLKETIVHLAVNARDAMPRGGRLTISTHTVVVDERSAAAGQLGTGTYATISVEDTGLGMDAETQARVFEPFFSTKAEGTGLGLSSAYGVVKQSGGDITITSAPSEGTRITILLPQAKAADAAPARRPASPPDADLERTVLLVEDNEKARELVARILRESGYRVYDAGLPEEALRFCDEHEGPIQLLLSDVVMPHMSGPTMAKQILERRPETRVLFVSGHVETQADAEIVLAGSDFLPKPFTPAELLARVRSILDGPPKRS